MVLRPIPSLLSTAVLIQLLLSPLCSVVLPLNIVVVVAAAVVEL